MLAGWGAVRRRHVSKPPVTGKHKLVSSGLDMPFATTAQGCWTTEESWIL